MARDTRDEHWVGGLWKEKDFGYYYVNLISGKLANDWPGTNERLPRRKFCNCEGWHIAREKFMNIDKQVGYSIHPYNKLGFVQAVDHLLQMPLNMRHKMGANARKKAVQYFGISHLQLPWGRG